MFRRCVVTLAVAAASLGVVAVRPGAGESSQLPVVDVYSSMPLRGASKVDSVPMLSGVRLALELAHGQAGGIRIRLISVDDSTPAAGKWDPIQTEQNARRAAADPRAVYYIGEFNSGASEFSIPILNQDGLAQVSPDNTYDGLTVRAPGTAPGEPQKWYPSGYRTFARLAARDSVQAAALLNTMRRDRCHTLTIANDQEAYGYGLAALVAGQARHYGVRILSNRKIDPGARSYRTYGRLVAGEHPGCFLFAGIVSNNAALVTEAAAAGAPHARLFGGDGICTTAFTDPTHYGIPAMLGRRFQCTELPLAVTAYPGGHAFARAYRTRYHTSPGAYAIYGFEAMKLGLDTITKLGATGQSRSAVRVALLGTKNRHSTIGTYSFDRNGDTTLRSYGLYTVHGSHGQLTFARDASH
jgi:branched-chain amino acid transport system substrate-binding protein